MGSGDIQDILGDQAYRVDRPGSSGRSVVDVEVYPSDARPLHLIRQDEHGRTSLGSFATLPEAQKALERELARFDPASVQLISLPGIAGIPGRPDANPSPLGPHETPQHPAARVQQAAPKPEPPTPPPAPAPAPPPSPTPDSRAQREKPGTGAASNPPPPLEIPDLPPSNGDGADQPGPRQEQNHEFSWALVLEEAAIGLVKAAAIAGAAVGAVALGVVSAPAVAVFGIVASVGMGINTFLVRGMEAMDTDQDDWVGRAVTAGISDMVPVVDPVGWGEAITGFDYMTGQEMTGAQQSQKLGTMISGTVGDMAGVGAVAGGLKTEKQKMRFVWETSDEFSDRFKSLEKSNPDASRFEVSTAAHELTQTALIEKHGPNVIDEPSVRMGHTGLVEGAKPIFHEGARADVWNKDLKCSIECKATVELRNGEMLVPKPVDGVWSWERTLQIQSQELFVHSNPDWTAHIVDSRGRVFTYDPKRLRWREESR